MSTRRNFIQNIALGGLLYELGSRQYFRPIDQNSVAKISWKKLKKCFRVASADGLNLNSGSAGNMPESIEKAFLDNIKRINAGPPYRVFVDYQSQIADSMDRLAGHIGTNSGTIAFTRNSSDGINYILYGLPWEEDDQLLYAEWDYPFVRNNLEKLEIERGIQAIMIKADLTKLSDAEIVELYENAITDATKMIVLTWITHREGQILPVKAICSMAKKYGVEVFIDGAHSLGQIEVNLDDLACDYYVCSLHKWLNAPLGSGLLYVSQPKVSKLKSKLSFPMSQNDNMEKFNYQGTRAFANIMTLPAVLDFFEQIPIEEKSKRLNALKNYWVDGIKDLESVSIITDPQRSCAIASFQTTKLGASKVSSLLYNKFKINVKPTNAIGGNGSMIRVSTNLFVDYKDLDRFIDAIAYVNALD